jgi:hypothetical protein
MGHLIGRRHRRGLFALSPLLSPLCLLLRLALLPLASLLLRLLLLLLLRRRSLAGGI